MFFINQHATPNTLNKDVGMTNVISSKNKKKQSMPNCIGKPYWVQICYMTIVSIGKPFI